MFGILLVVLLLGLTQAQSPLPGACPTNIATMQDFDIQKYTGRWYEHARYPSMFEVSVRCVYEDYQLLPNHEVSINASNINQKNEIHNAVFKANVVGPGKLSVHYDLSGVSGAVNYWILETDYKNYSVIYSCYQFAQSYTKFVWILKREKIMDKAALNAAFTVLTKYGLPLTPLVERDQSNCNN